MNLDFCTIPLTNGHVAIVDTEDYGALFPFKWHAQWNPNSETFYVARHAPLPDNKNRKILMHREILSAPPELLVDHRDGNGLNNRRCNIRTATAGQNQHNRAPVRGTITGLKGVSFHSPTGLWMARIRLNYKRHYLGLFNTPEAASVAYVEAAKRLHGEFAQW